MKTYLGSATDYGFAAEVEGLRALRSVVPGIDPVDGWRARSIELLEADPVARRLTTTVAPGRPLAVVAHLAAADRVAALDLVEAVVRAFWAATGAMYGDLTLENVLVDRDERSVTFIDPGPPREVWECPTVARRHWPASRDVGYLLYAALVGLRPRSTTWRRRADLAWDLAERFVPPDDPEGFVEEALRCTQVHVERLRTTGPSIRRLLAHHRLQARISRFAPGPWKTAWADRPSTG